MILVLKTTGSILLVLCLWLCAPNLPIFSFGALLTFPTSEWLALEDLYYSTGGPNWDWKNDTLGAHWNFSTETNPCTADWQGLKCEVDHVTGITLGHYGLAGRLPSSIGNFSELKFLHMEDNGLTGPIPETIVDCRHLRSLILSFNRLTGSIPAEFYIPGNFSALYLDNNHLSGTIPASLGNLTNLILFYLLENRFSGTIPPALGKLRKVQALHLNYNRLNGSIPITLGQLSNVNELDLTQNFITGTLPNELGNLALLEKLFVSNNRLTGTLPASLGDLPVLKQIFLTDNNFTGTIPESYGFLSKLEKLYLNHNMLTSTIPIAFSNLDRMTHLDLQSNELTGMIPTTLGTWSDLKELVLYNNQLTGQLFDLQNLSSLTAIDLSKNQLTGTIPASIGTLTAMFGITLNLNMFSGLLPLLKEKSLNYAYMESNLLSGTIPAVYGNLSRLVYLLLDNNHLEGTIPLEFSALRELSVLTAQQNHLTGSLQNLFDPLVQTKLDSVLLSSNQLTGTLPAEVFSLASLKTFSAATNCFSGSLPITICNNSLATLVLDGASSASPCRQYMLPTRLSHSYIVEYGLGGTIPTCLLSAERLVTLHLSGVDLRGTIPDLAEYGQALLDVSFSHNKLTGTIPQSMQRRKWYNLDLSYNRLSGTLNSDFGQLPVNYSQLVRLGILNPEDEGTYKSSQLSLEQNSLSGRIPTSIVDRENVSVLGSNLFSCDVTERNLPQHDPGKRSYQCASNSFDYIYYTWLSLTFLLACVVLTLWLRRSHIEGGLTARMFTTVRQWLAVFDPGFPLIIWSVVGPPASSFSNMTASKPSELSLVRLSSTGDTSIDKKHSNLESSDISPEISASQSANSRSSSFSSFSAATWTAGATRAIPTPHIRKVGSVLDLWWSVAFWATVWITAVLVPAYAILGQGSLYGIYTYQYAWLVSAAYISGTVPTLVELALLVCLIIIVSAVFFTRLRIYAISRVSALRRESSHATLPGSEDSRSYTTGTDRRTWRKWIHSMRFYGLYVGINLVVVVSANVAYILVAIYEDSEVLLVAQLLLSLFKFVWNNVCANTLARYIEKLLMTAEIQQTAAGSGSRNRLHSTEIAGAYGRDGFLFVHILVSLVNNIAVPCIVVILVNPSCFYNVFVPAPGVDSTFNFWYCLVAVHDGYCVTYLPDLVSTSYSPPFDYEYQCSDSIITYYAPAFAFLCIGTTFVTPVVQITLHKLYNRITGTLPTPGREAAAQAATMMPMTTTVEPIPVQAQQGGDQERIGGDAVHGSIDNNTILHKIQWIFEKGLKKVVPRLLKPISTDPILVSLLRQQLLRPIFDANQVIVSLVTNLGLLMTFGAAFPPLAVAFLVSIVSVVVFTKCKLGRFVVNALELGAGKYVEIVELECHRAGSVEILERSLWFVLFFSCWFYSLFLFDTLGRAVGHEAAAWVLLALPLLPLVLYGSRVVLLQQLGPLGSGRQSVSRNPNTTATSNSDCGRKSDLYTGTASGDAGLGLGLDLELSVDDLSSRNNAANKGAPAAPGKEQSECSDGVDGNTTTPGSNSNYSSTSSTTNNGNTTKRRFSESIEQARATMITNVLHMYTSSTNDNSNIVTNSHRHSGGGAKTNDNIDSENNDDNNINCSNNQL